MPFNGVGTYAPPAADFPVVSGTTVSSTHFNNTVNDIATALSDCVTRDGQSAWTQNLPAGGFKLTGMGAGSVRGDSTRIAEVQDSTFHWAGTVGGTADAITLTVAPVILAYVAGQTFFYKSGASPNANPMTVVVSGLSTKAIQKNGSALAAGDHPANSWFRITYDGAAFQLEQIGPRSAEVTAYIAAQIATVYQFPAGTAILFQQTAAPTGFTKVTTHNDKTLRVVSGTVGSGGNTAFTTVFGAGLVTGAHTLTIAEMPAHTHASAIVGGTFATSVAGGWDTGPSGSTGGGGSHTHTLSLDLQYVDVIIATKN